MCDMPRTLSLKNVLSKIFHCIDVAELYHEDVKTKEALGGFFILLSRSSISKATSTIEDEGRSGIR